MTFSIRPIPRDVALTRDEVTELDPLLGSSFDIEHVERVKKPWRRPRPLWLVPFAIAAALCKSMTLAPRTQVFTQLACRQLRSSGHHHTLQNRHTAPIETNLSLFHVGFPSLLDIEAAPLIVDAVRNSMDDSQSKVLDKDAEKSSMAGGLPIECLTDPSVQAGAAKMQTMMTTTMGLLSALTTGWWGHFGDRHGRTKVIACAIVGLLFTDLMFIIASNPPAVLRGHANILLLIAPVVEGLLGGWTTLQAATFAYISDCTSHGSRAHVFSRFSGSFFIGIAFGPEIAALILHSTQNVTTVFYTASACAATNLLLALSVFPESLSKEVRARNVAKAREGQMEAIQDASRKRGLLRSAKNGILAFVKPMRILGPRSKAQGHGQDWSMTLITIVMFCHYLTLGLFHIKYLYAEHMFSWSAEQLSTYITVAGSGRALHLILILPTVIRFCKPVSSNPDPKSTSPSTSRSKSKTATGKGTPTQATLLSEIRFDMLLGKVSLGIDLLSQALVILAQDTSQPLFVVFSTLSGLGTGLVPAMQSVAMSLMLLSGDDGNIHSDKGGAEVGKLFGAIAVVQAVGSMMLGPMLFGTVYSLTVAQFPKAIFVVTAVLLSIGTSLLFLIRRPRLAVPSQTPVDAQIELADESARGRSRKSKDIRQSLSR